MKLIFLYLLLAVVFGKSVKNSLRVNVAQNLITKDQRKFRSGRNEGKDFQLNLTESIVNKRFHLNWVTSPINRAIDDRIGSFMRSSINDLIKDGIVNGVNDAEKLISKILLQSISQHIHEIFLSSKENSKQYCTGTDNKGRPYCIYEKGSPDSKLIINAPHGGDLLPESITSRVDGCMNGNKCKWCPVCPIRLKSECKTEFRVDHFTKPIAKVLVNEIERLTGKRPHFIITELHRDRLDMNRDYCEATFREPEASVAYEEIRNFITQARETVAGNGNSYGLFLDIHGQSHSHGLNELGYLIYPNDLNNGNLDPSESSIKALARRSNSSFEDIIRGDKSLGNFLQQEGFDTLPSPTFPSPGDMGYYTGGYNTEFYGSYLGGNIDAIQIEVHKKHRTNSSYLAFTKALAKAIVNFMNENDY